MITTMITNNIKMKFLKKCTGPIKMSAKFTIDELLTCTSAKLKLKACVQHMN